MNTLPVFWFQYFGMRRENTEVVAQGCCVKKVFLEFLKIHRKTPVPESLF